MTEHKFTDEEVIESLVWHQNGEELSCCHCPYEKITRCSEKLTKDALGLINRQKEEIEVIKETTAEIRYEAVKEFAERLKTYYRNLDKTAGTLVEYHIDETVKEMLEGG